MSLTAEQLQFLMDRGLTIADAVELARLGQPEPVLSKGAARTRQWRERLEASGMTGEQWRQTSIRIIARDGNKCCYCGTGKGRMMCDHVTPLAQGGDSSDANLVCACHACNGGKSGRTLEEWKGAAWAASWRRGDITSDITRDISHVGERAQGSGSFSSSLRSEEVGGGGVERERAQIPSSNDWPAGKAQHHAKLIVEAVASPWLDTSKSPDLVTTAGRIDAWKRAGASWEADVLPVVTTLCAKQRSRVGTWKFFDQAIARSIADNRAALEIPEGRARATGPPANSMMDRMEADRAEARRRAING